MKSTSCREHWLAEKNNEIKTLRKLWRLYQSGDENGDPDLGRFEEHGLSFDYVAPGTFKNKRGYWRYQISYGGPSDEFRFYAEPLYRGRNFEPSLVRIEYWFLDWFDGYGRKLTGKDEALMREIWENFVDCGVVAAEWKKACDE